MNYEHRIDKQKYFNIHLTSVYKYFNKYIFKENYSSIINYYSKQRMLFYFIFYVYYNEKILLFFRDSRFTILRFFLFFPRFTHFLAKFHLFLKDIFLQPYGFFFKTIWWKVSWIWLFFVQSCFSFQAINSLKLMQKFSHKIEP